MKICTAGILVVFGFDAAYLKKWVLQVEDDEKSAMSNTFSYFS
jgi:hypothetical protein